MKQVQTVMFVKRTSGGGGDLPPPPEPPAIEGQGLSVPAPPDGLKVRKMEYLMRNDLFTPL